ncbi:MAG: hypothetical protein WA851_01120 [Xanthobacteraceae bacterium]
MKTLVSAVVLLIAAFATSGFAQPRNIAARFGFLGEYELSAAVSPETSGGESTLTGPMTIRHVGLCTHNGPNEDRGEIAIRIAEAKSQITATFAFDGQQCVYKGGASRANIGELVCSRSKVPFSIWFDR